MERKYGKWSFAQAESERDPLLSNVKHYNDAPPYPINYPVPNFGVDEDIISTQKHIKDMEVEEDCQDIEEVADTTRALVFKLFLPIICV